MLRFFLIYPMHVASIAQWLEHWSCKPGVGSSILPGGFAYFFLFCKYFIIGTNRFKKKN